MESGLAIFDHDGVLVDSFELHRQAWLILRDRTGLPLTSEFIHLTFGMANPSILQKLMGQDYTPELGQRYGDLKEEAYREVASQSVCLMDGMPELLDALKNAQFRLAIGSSAPLANLQLTIAKCQLQSHFQAVASLEDVKRGKPDPEIFLVAASKAQVPPHKAVVFEDAVVGIQAAKAAGMLAVGLTTTHPAQSLINAGADLVLDRVVPNEIDGLLRWIVERLGS